MGASEAIGTDRIIEINGKTLRMRKIIIDDLGEYTEVLRHQKLKSLSEILKSLEPQERKDMINQIMNEDISYEKIFEELQKPAGIAFMLRRCLDVNKDLTPDDIKAVLSMDGMIERFTALMPGVDQTANPPILPQEGSP